MPSHDPYLHHDEFAKFRDTDFADLKADVLDVRKQVKEVKEDVREFKEDVREFKEDVREFKEDVHRQFSNVNKELTSIKILLALNAQAVASIRNSYVRRVTAPIYPLVKYDPVHDAILEPEQFPRHADDFYSLRKPDNARSRRLLIYLARFYDAPLETIVGQRLSSSDSDDNHSISSNSSADEKSGHDYDAIILQHSSQVAEFLEQLLGLSRENFDFEAFREQANAYASRSPQPPVKRLHEPENPSDERELKKLAYRRPATDSDRSQPGESVPDNAALEWRNKSRSTPPSQRTTMGNVERVLRRREQGQQSAEDEAGRTTVDGLTLLREERSQRKAQKAREGGSTSLEGGLQQHQRQAQSFDSGSPTNPNTSPRDIPPT